MKVSVCGSPCFGSFADFSILYIHSFVYTVYDELAGRRQGPGPSGEDAAHRHTLLPTTETDTGEVSPSTVGIHSKCQKTNIYSCIISASEMAILLQINKC